MRRRLYFVLPDLRAAEIVERELLLARVGSQQIHFLARDDVPLGRLSAAGLLQRSDLIPGLQVGFALGGLTGALVGFALYMHPEIGQSIGMGGMLVLGSFGAIVGAWASGMIAVSIPSRRLKRFQAAIDRGEILLMVDVPTARTAEIRGLIQAHHPKARAYGEDAQIPAFP